MNDKVLQIISLLNGTAEDLEKVENKKYGYKSSAVRARKVFQEAIVLLKELRKEVQNKKNEAEGQ